MTLPSVSLPGKPRANDSKSLVGILTLMVRTTTGDFYKFFLKTWEYIPYNLRHNKLSFLNVKEITEQPHQLSRLMWLIVLLSIICIHYIFWRTINGNTGNIIQSSDNSRHELERVCLKWICLILHHVNGYGK